MKNEKTYDPKKTIYVPKRFAKLWAAIEKAAYEDGHGVGSFISKKWRDWVK